MIKMIKINRLHFRDHVRYCPELHEHYFHYTSTGR